MPAGGFSVSAPSGVEFEAKITPIVVISCIMAATGGLMFGYDVGISGTASYSHQFPSRISFSIIASSFMAKPFIDRHVLFIILHTCCSVRFSFPIVNGYGTYRDYFSRLFVFL